MNCIHCNSIKIRDSFCCYHCEDCGQQWPKDLDDLKEYIKDIEWDEQKK